LPHPGAQHVDVQVQVTGNLAQVADLPHQLHGVGLLFGRESSTASLRHRDILAHLALAGVSTNSGQGQTDNSTDRPKLTGTVEADETYVGGKPRNKGMQFKNKRGTGAKTTPVIAVVQRGGDVRMRVVIGRVSTAKIRAAVCENVDMSARLMTDESSAHTVLGREFKGGHEAVQHSAREYARGDAHSNTIEGVFSLLKRGMYGTFHSVSKKHLHRYVSEFEFRHNMRKLDDGERTARAIKASEGKRLTYAQQVGR